MFEKVPQMLRMFGGIYQRKYSSCGKETANKGGGGVAGIGDRELRE